MCFRMLIRLRLLKQRRDAGFTLIEMTIGITILALIMGAIAATMMVAMVTAPEAEGRLPDNHDIQFTSAFFGSDVQGAQTIAVTGAPKCTDGTPGDVLAIEFAGVDFAASADDQITLVSYVVRSVSNPQGDSKELVRLVCVSDDASPTYPLPAPGPIVLARQLSLTVAPAIVCENAAEATVDCADPSAIWVSATFVNESGENIYSVRGVRRIS